MPTAARARVVVADDHEAVLERVTALLADEFTVVAAVSDGAQLVEAEAKFQPDILVVDVCMPTMSGVEAAAEIRRRGSRVPVVWVTSSDPDVLESARDIGALGYVHKTSLLADLIPAIRAALKGEAYVSRGAGERPAKA